MNNNYCLSGTKIVIRRLFKQDTADILSCYEEYNTLFHNPVSAEYLENIFLCGEIWGAYLGGSIIGCCYYFPMDSGFFRNTAFGSALADFTDCTGKYYFMGYMGIKHKNISCGSNCSNVPTESGLYQAFSNVAQMQAFRRGLKYIMHACPVKKSRCAETLFCCGYSLIKIRGLENLVVHYIYVKPVFNEENIYGTDFNSEPLKVCLSDTKKVSALLENGYCGVDYSKAENLLYIRRLIAD